MDGKTMKKSRNYLNNNENNNKLRKERQKIQREIRSIIRTENDNRTSEKLEETEKQKDDDIKCFMPSEIY